MEILTSNTVSILSIIFCIWALLCLFAYLLIQFRRDSSFVIEDINKFLLAHGYPYRLFSVMLLFIVLPISIPYSLAHIFKK